MRDWFMCQGSAACAKEDLNRVASGLLAEGRIKLLHHKKE